MVLTLAAGLLVGASGSPASPATPPSPPVEAAALPSPPIEGQIADEDEEIQSILEYHHTVHRLDGRLYGLPENDFDDATNISLKQRRWFRATYPETSASGDYQYPRYAYDLVRRQDLEAGRAFAATIETLAVLEAGLLPMGTDETAALSSLIVGTNLNTSNDNLSESESFLAIDPTNQRYMVGSANNNNGSAQYQYRSTDWGATWATNVLPISCFYHSDPGGAFDSLGNAYSITLEYSGSACGTSTKVNIFRSTDHGATWSAPSTVSGLSNNDKELMAMDYQPGSPCRDHLYAAWDRSGSVYAAAASNWLGPWTTASGLDLNSIGTDVSFGPGGEAYVVWANNSTRGINFSKSANCGVNWGPKVTIATTADSYDYGIPAMCSRRALIYPSMDVDRTTGPRRGWIYVVWNDFSAAQGSGCVSSTSTSNANIWLSRSMDGGATWSAPAMVNADIAQTDQFNQWMRVDDADGAIHVSWHDTRNDSARKKTDVYYTRSLDGGATWEPEVKLTTEQTDETTAGSNGNQYGDYEGLAVHNGAAYSFWTDRRSSSGVDEEIFTSKICSDPKLVTTTAAFDTNACKTGSITASWTAPSIFWGDGGSGTRKYQLLKDAALVVDNISDAATSVTYTPGDTLSHSYIVKAVNSCGSVAAYSAAAATDGADAVAPARVPDAVFGVRAATTANFTWTASPSTDVSSYKVYGAGSLTAPFPSGWTLLGQPSALAYSDPLGSANRFYLVSSVDGCGNESTAQ